MVQLDMNDLNLISRTIEMVKNKGMASFSSAPTYNSTSASPSKTNKKYLNSSTSSSPTSSSSSSSSQVPKLMSYPMTPIPPPVPLPFPIGCCLRWFCGGNMKWVAFPLLCAISLGLFLAFNRAATVGYVADQGYNQHLNSRQLSDDEPELMPQIPGMFGHNDHMLMGQPRWGVQGPGRGQCDCSKCDEEEALYFPTEARYKKLIKHSLQHFYGRKELALSIQSFVPFKRKLWDLGFALYTTASEQCEGLEQPEAVILVMSEARHSERRNSIRRTWGSVAKGTGWPNRRVIGDVRLIFVLGVSKTRDHNDVVTREAEAYGDVILVDSPEGPEFSTRKVLSGFKWVQMYCSQTQYVIKVDEDVFLDLPRLLELLSNQEMANMIYGSIYISQQVPREITETQKIAIAHQAYMPNWFPPYAKGYFYAMPTALSKRLVDVSEFLPYVGVEDVFITGILAKVFDARHINVPQAIFDRTGTNHPDLCDFVFQSRIAARNIAPEMAQSMWRRIERPEMCGFMPGIK